MNINNFNYSNDCQNNEEENSMNCLVKKTKNEITSSMRDYIWEQFKSLYLSHGEIDCMYLAKLASANTGITQGSAYIYYLILSNLVSGSQNKRTMKFEDLIVYLNNIKEQLPDVCIRNSIKSLSDSIPYWEEHIPGYFAKKVRVLIDNLSN